VSSSARSIWSTSRSAEAPSGPESSGPLLVDREIGPETSTSATLYPGATELAVELAILSITGSSPTTTRTPSSSTRSSGTSTNRIQLPPIPTAATSRKVRSLSSDRELAMCTATPAAT